MIYVKLWDEHIVVDVKTEAQRICYYKNLDWIEINDYKIWDATRTITKPCFFYSLNEPERTDRDTCLDMYKEKK